MNSNHNPGASPYLPEAVPYNPHSNLPEVYHSQNHAAYPQYDAAPQQHFAQAHSPTPSNPPRYSELAAGYQHGPPAPAPKVETEYREEPVLPPRQPWWRRHLLLLCIAAILIVGAAVGGGVGGTLAAEKKKGVVGVDGQQEGAGAG